MANNVTPIRPPSNTAGTPADIAAQDLWHGVATASDTIGELISDIPAAGVRGEETRSELHQAQVLLGQAAELLERTVARYAEWGGS